MEKMIKNIWKYVSAAGFLTLILLIGLLTLHVVFFYIIPLILALIIGFWVFCGIVRFLGKKN